MGNNDEIRKRMETYRKVLLAVVWIVGIAGMIAGLVMISYQTGGRYSSNPLRPYGIALLILSIIGSIIGHFLINVGLAIPFILLNNGDYLAAIVPEGKLSKINNFPEDIQTENNNEKYIGKYFITNKSINLKYGSSSDTNTIKIIDKGIKVKFVSGNNIDWYCIETSDGERGFCQSSDLELIV